MDRDDAFFGEALGFGVFLPPNRGGWTEDLLFTGAGVQHIKLSHQSAWQVSGKYSIHDSWRTGYVFVPSTPGCLCKLFRAQHVASSNNPTHALVHELRQPVMLVALRPMGPGDEITFDYFAGEHEVSPVIGNGLINMRRDWDDIEERAKAAGNRDQHRRLGFSLAQMC